TLETVTPMRLAHALSPERAAHLEGMQLTLHDLIAAARIGDAADFFVVEGAGGFLSPLASDALNADLAVALGLPVLVVAADRLGSINHTLLTVEAIERRGLRLAGIVLNALEPDAGDDMANRDDLLGQLGGPVIPFPHGREDRETGDTIAGIVARANESA
ncbi:MAG: dethiobiotin synthase, partial [Halofilum sp. (in: g-proteobacteria)]